MSARLCGKRAPWREALLVYSGSTFGRVLSFYEQATWIRTGRIAVSYRLPIPSSASWKPSTSFDPTSSSGMPTISRCCSGRSQRDRSTCICRDLAIFGGEALTAPGRELIARGFGVPLTALYNAVESFKIGFACEKGQDYHLHEDLCHVKIVNRTGARMADGERGEVVISNLVNRATVLLNYRIGDVAARVTQRCDCGRTLPLLREIEGRVEDVLVLPNGAFLHPLAIWGVFKDKRDVLRYQLTQHAIDRFELRLVTTDRKKYDDVLPTILRELHMLLGECREHRVQPPSCVGAAGAREVPGRSLDLQDERRMTQWESRAGAARQDSMQIPGGSEILDYARRVGWRRAFSWQAMSRRTRPSRFLSSIAFSSGRKTFRSRSPARTAITSADFCAQDEVGRFAGQLDAAFATGPPRRRSSRRRRLRHPRRRTAREHRLVRRSAHGDSERPRRRFRTALASICIVATRRWHIAAAACTPSGSCGRRRSFSIDSVPDVGHRLRADQLSGHDFRSAHGMAAEWSTVSDRRRTLDTARAHVVRPNPRHATDRDWETRVAWPIPVVRRPVRCRRRKSL